MKAKIFFLGFALLSVALFGLLVATVIMNRPDGAVMVSVALCGAITLATMNYTEAWP